MNETDKTNSLSGPEISSIKRQLDLLTSFELVEYLESLLKQDKVRVELVESLVAASNKAQTIYPGLLAKCIVATKSRAFFDACESKFENAPVDLIPIFETFYSKKIEQQLCDYFHKELQSKEPFPHFDSCIHAFKKNGRELTLEILQALEHEYGPKADLAKVIFSATQEAKGEAPLEIDEFLHSLIDGLTIHRLVEIRKTIAALQSNMQSSPTNVSSTIQTQPLPDLKTQGISREYEYVTGSLEDYARNAMERSEVHKHNAEDLLSLSRYADAGNNYRKSAEAILKAVFAIRVQQTKVPNTLDRLKAGFKSSPGQSLPDTIGAAIEVVQTIGNLASHDQSDTLLKPNAKLMTAVQNSLQAIASWAQSVIKN
jgi:hypothetical protein